MIQNKRYKVNIINIFIYNKKILWIDQLTSRSIFHHLYLKIYIYYLILLFSTIVELNLKSLIFPLRLNS